MADWQQSTGVSGPAAAAAAAADTDVVVNSKRQRRPSVRLGEIGDQSAAYDTTNKRKKQQQQQPQWSQMGGFFTRYGASSSDFPPGPPGKLSKTRPLVNIGSEGQVVLDESIAHFGFHPITDNKMQLNPMCVSKKVRHGRTRRKGMGMVGKQPTRTMRVSPENNNNNDNNGINNNGHDKGSGDDNGFGASYDADTPDGFKDSDLDTSGSPPMKETCTIHLDSPDSRPPNLGGSSECQEVSGNERGEEGTWGKKEASTGYGNDVNGMMGGLDLPSDVDTRSNKQDVGVSNGGLMMRGGGMGDVDEKLISAARYFAMARDVRSWLGGLGLGRYAELFEMHEVDKDVLPLLTLDDLREMGINAVGARRKIYSAIQKIGKRYTA